jgi:hypothetical protein
MRFVGMMEWTGRTLAAATLVVVLAGCGDGPVEPRDGQGGVLLQTSQVVNVTDAWSGYQAATRVVISNADAWATAWATIHAHYTEVPPLPSVDFASSVLVLAAMGPRPTTGHSVTIDEVRASDGTLQVNVTERTPGPTCGTGQAITSPVHVVQAPRQGTTASFTVNAVTYSC